jgi:predicted RNase H-like HicB family nuclease
MTSEGNEAVRTKRITELAYPAQLDAEEDGGYFVTFPDLGVGVTQGNTRQEALVQAADLLETMVANYMRGLGLARAVAGSWPTAREA